jgi:diguanylate cyclase (GGDEF)-like protein
MPRSTAPALTAFTLFAAIACGAAAYAARRLGLGPLPGGLFVAVIALGYASSALTIVSHLRRRTDREADELSELTEQLGRSASEAQSRRLLLRYVQRLVPTGGVVLLTPSDNAAELELTYGERVVDTPLLELASVRMAAQSCRALESGAPREVHLPDQVAPAAGVRVPAEPRTEAASAVECLLCGRLAGELTCRPLRAAGRQTAALLVAAERIETPVRERIHAAAERAAPVLAMQHQQAASERRAGSDPLTALPNRPAAEQTLRRLCAQAGRTVSPLAAILLGVDEPPKLRRDRDQALALIGHRLAEAARASDYIARFDSHAFLVLAPDTDREGGVELAEKLRRQLEILEHGARARLTASLGVAAIPMDALAPDDLLRQADRALAVARALGGNRVQPAESSLAP